MSLQRIFIALELPLSIKKQIIALQKNLKAQFANKVRWVRPQNMHLTLAFLGNRSSGEIEKIFRVVEALAQSTPEITIKPQRIKNFRYVLALQASSKKLEILFQRFKKAMQKEGIVYFGKRKFQTHITIGRIRKPLLKRFSQKINFPSFRMTKIAVLKSTLLKEDAKHEIIRCYVLRHPD